MGWLNAIVGRRMNNKRRSVRIEQVQAPDCVAKREVGREHFGEGLAVGANEQVRKIAEVGCIVIEQAVDRRRGRAVNVSAGRLEAASARRDRMNVHSVPSFRQARCFHSQKNPAWSLRQSHHPNRLVPVADDRRRPGHAIRRAWRGKESAGESQGNQRGAGHREVPFRMRCSNDAAIMIRPQADRSI